MEQAINKLVDLFSQAVVRVGGEAERLYPEVVKIYMIEQIMPFLTATPTAIVAAAVFVWASRRLMKTGDEMPWAPVMLASGLVGLFTFFVSLMEIRNAVRAWYSPEAAFVLDHFRRLMN